ncbi:MAG: N-methyl-D-aspartate receptor NMDAR2C subunit [Cyanobacteriota bacterium]|nr:N-methyl-D-aspartate receptor NMDAR2C subunit [Cyanobacteriota bacterium]
MTSLARWHKTWQQLGAASGSENLYERVSACYAESHRKYHTMQHLEECFSYFELIRDHAEHQAEVELAIWFHDAIYRVSSKDNEEKSAKWAYASTVSSSLPKEIGERVYSLILVTRHNAVSVSRDAEVLVDVDLGILAAEPKRFDEYEVQVRAEYAWVPEPLYRRERRKVLQEFVNRASLYSTALFRERYEVQARKNLSRSLARL